ncbi:MAG: insulinase family protein [Bacteroidales bacterium]|nr:insulinase family protein [Bacteroidales bacterium]HOY39185.1 insulinase family protein [Bacteroidales bacterium]HQP04441.1 insulinase family protein [Bacteroidales bacterium]
MKKLLFLSLLGLAFLSLQAQNFDYKPVAVDVYQLDNGLTVILSEDHTQPQVFGGVIVRAGGKDDPPDATGMAHYQEHMLFKGTQELGTTNWEAEKIHIDSIFMLYDELGKTTDEVTRANIQKKINEQSLKANEYVIPNELSNLIKVMGGTDLNAGTGQDITIYYNAFPPSEINKWLDLYSHRFENPVFRSFQAELEVVYEEKNMYSDIFIFPLLESFNKQFFKNHPYGQQTLIGSVEDLKNPSLSKMFEFFKTWYVPNNMALIIVGDFDKEAIKPMINEKFGKWVKRELPIRPVYEEKAFNGREFAEVKLSPIKLALLGFRTVPAGHSDEIVLEVCNAILSNQNQTGLLDKLVNNNELMAAQALNMPYNDHGACLFLIVPKILGQKLSDAEQLVMNEIDKLKSGDFDDYMIENIKLELYRNYLLSMESNDYKANMLAAAFGRYQSVEDLLSYPQKLMAITKDDVIKIAQKYYGDNYLAFYSNMGFPKKEKIEKPGFKPIVSNTESESQYARHFNQIAPVEKEITYINFENDITHVEISSNIDIYGVKNPANDIFSLKIKIKAGYEKIPMLKYATDLMNYAHPEGVLFDDFKEKVARLGCTYSFSGNESYTEIEIIGVESNISDAIQLVGELLNKPVIDQDKINILYEGEKANRKMERSEPDAVADALFEFVKYGKASDFIDRLSLKEIKALQADSLAIAFRDACNYGVEFHYVGQNDIQTIADLCKTTFRFEASKFTETPVVKPIAKFSENTIYFVHKKKATQSKVYYLANGFEYTPDIQASMDAFNLYFGGDFSGLVLQEIREYRSMAYSAGAKYVAAIRKGEQTYFMGYVGTQADKTVEAMVVFDSLIRTMPEKPERLKMIQQYLLLSSSSDRPHFRSLSEQILAWKIQGFESDPAKMKKECYTNLRFTDISGFYKEHLAGKPLAICIVGDKSKIDMAELSKYGKVVFIKESSLFNE